MTLALGIDTGGTFTDAVLWDPGEGRVVASAKALTTRVDLAVGIGNAVKAVLQGRDPSGIQLVGLSTTLATNAVVEGHGNPAALILIGYPDRAAAHPELKRALGSDPLIRVAGGHAPSGDEAAPLDLADLDRAVVAVAGRVSAFAIAGYFAVRNPDHEQRARERVIAMTGRPTSCGHELSLALDAPRRAVTALVNARLVPQSARLVAAVRRILGEIRISAPLMVVKGDGSLVADGQALLRPVETILSGPAASVVGARALTGATDVFVSDIGGTTTDIAVLEGGRPALAREGARVGSLRTMVEAVEITTLGIGGDSEVRIEPDHGLVLGPRRRIPIALMIDHHPELMGSLKEQVERGTSTMLEAAFAIRSAPNDCDLTQLSEAEGRIWDALARGPAPLERIVTSHILDTPLRRLVDRGLVAISAFTPTDAAHVLGLHRSWSTEAAELAARLWARRPVEPGWHPFPGPVAFALAVRERLVAQTASALAEAALSHEGADPAMIRTALGRRATDRPQPGRLLSARVTLERPVVAIGAAASAYYSDVAERLGCRLVVPPDAPVASAVGAVAGVVEARVEATITQPGDGVFRVHAASTVRSFPTLEDAVRFAEDDCLKEARTRALTSGAAEVEAVVRREDKVASTAGGLDIFIESRIEATARGRPALTGPAGS